MAFQLDATVSAPAHVRVREIAGDTVLLNVRTGACVALDAMGTRLWAALTKTNSIGSACERLLADYEIEPEALHEECRVFIERLEQHGLAEVGKA